MDGGTRGPHYTVRGGATVHVNVVVGIRLPVAAAETEARD